MNPWKILESRYLLKHPMVRIRQDTCQLPDERIIDDYYVVEEHDVALIFALTSDDKVLLVEQYKHAIGKTCIELPGGYLDSADEDPLLAAQRELREETGYTSDKWHLLATYVNQPTRCNSRTSIYLATEAQRVSEQNLDPNEEITIHALPMAEVFERIRTGAIDVALTIAAVYQAQDYLNRQ